MNHSRFAKRCQHCGQSGHLVMDCNTYLLQVPGHRYRLTLLSQCYANDPGCIPLRGTLNFTLILARIRRHLLFSETTQDHYITVTHKFQSQLAGDSKVLDQEVCREKFISFVRKSWPTFRSFVGSLTRVEWGYVLKGADTSNEVAILNDLVSVAEIAAANPRPDLLPLSLYNLLITITILHELSHAFTKYLFANMVTPEGVGPNHRGRGESGWLLEELLIPDGFISASWDRDYHVGNMRLIKRVVLQKNNDAACVIDVETADKILHSLGSTHFIPPSRAAHTLPELQGSDYRARVTKTTTLPKKEEAVPVGLGFCSFVGSDKWDIPWQGTRGTNDIRYHR